MNPAAVRSALLVLLALALAHPAEAAVRFALVVGSNVGLAEETVLAWAERDAERVAEVFEDLGEVVSDRIILQRGKSVAELERGLARLQGQLEEVHRRGERAEVFVYYSGHGDAESLHIAGERFLLETLQKRVAALPADATVVILDACRSAPVRSGSRKGAKLAPAFDVNLTRELSPHGSVLIASAASLEVAQESDDLEGAFFTHHFVAALRGAADGDGDQRVTLSEAYTYAHGRTLAGSFGTRAAVQHPEMTTELSGEGALVLTELNRARARLRLLAALPGRYLVSDARSGRVLTEVEQPGTRDIVLAVPAVLLVVQRRNAMQSARGEVDMQWGGERTISPDDLDEEVRVASNNRGLSDLSPWWLSASASVGTPPTTRLAPAGGLALTLERRLFDWPLLLGTRHRIVVAPGENERWTFLEGAYRGTLGGSADWFLGPVRVWTGLYGGIEAVGQRRLRKDRARLAGILSERAATEYGYSVGPVATGLLGTGLRLGFGLFLFGAVEVNASAQALSGDIAALFDAHALVGAAWEF